MDPQAEVLLREAMDDALETRMTRGERASGDEKLETVSEVEIDEDGLASPASAEVSPTGGAAPVMRARIAKPHLRTSAIKSTMQMETAGAEPSRRGSEGGGHHSPERSQRSQRSQRSSQRSHRNSFGVALETSKSLSPSVAASSSRSWPRSSAPALFPIGSPGSVPCPPQCAVCSEGYEVAPEGHRERLLAARFEKEKEQACKAAVEKATRDLKKSHKMDLVARGMEEKKRMSAAREEGAKQAGQYQGKAMTSEVAKRKEVEEQLAKAKEGLAEVSALREAVVRAQKDVKRANDERVEAIARESQVVARAREVLGSNEARVECVKKYAQSLEAAIEMLEVRLSQRTALAPFSSCHCTPPAPLPSHV